MQSIFRLPWCSDPIATKVSEHAALEKMRASPVVEIPVLSKLKRKRTITSEVPPMRSHDHKKARVEQTQPATSFAPAKLNQAETVMETSGTLSATVEATETASVRLGQAQRPSLASPSAMRPDLHQPLKTIDSSAETMATESLDVNGLTPLQQVIENEFNMQILLKHNELRLIEQELAKCQVALEQLRRCELRPYPGSNHLSAGVTAGTGPSIAPPPGYTRPSHPAPHGVTDGPYSRHYRQWLLQDPRFDSVPLHLMRPEVPGRPTRNSAPARKSVGQPFTFPGRPAPALPSIPNYPASAPKERNLPNVLRRSTDGQLVKLICNNCERGNFSSIQGFLNHCRIAHKVDYKSHDAAAIDCGRLLEDGEAANLPVEPVHTPAPKPALSRVSTAAPTPTSRSFVHSFNTSTGAPLVLSQPQKPLTPRQAAPSLSSAPPAATAQQPFNPSNQLPRLSAVFAKHNFGGDLAKAAAEAKQKIDLGVDYDLPSPDIISEQNSPLGTPSLSRTVGGPSTGSLGINNAHQGPPSRKGFRQPTPQHAKARPSPLASLKQESSGEVMMMPGSPHSPDHHLHHHHDSSSSLHELSPHTAADSNPGLVSDHEEDDDHGSASESEDAPPAPHHRATSRLPVGAGDGTTCAEVGVEDMMIDVAVADDENIGLVIRRGSVGAGGKRSG